MQWYGYSFFCFYVFFLQMRKAVISHAAAAAVFDCLAPMSPCRFDQWQCPGTTDRCINRTQICDHVPDCPDGDDESPLCSQFFCFFFPAFLALYNCFISNTIIRSSNFQVNWENNPSPFSFPFVFPPFLFYFCTFLSASLYVSKRGAYWDRLCRDVVGWLIIGCWLFGCHAHALWPNGAS